MRSGHSHPAVGVVWGMWNSCSLGAAAMEKSYPVTLRTCLPCASALLAPFSNRRLLDPVRSRFRSLIKVPEQTTHCGKCSKHLCFVWWRCLWSSRWCLYRLVPSTTGADCNAQTQLWSYGWFYSFLLAAEVAVKPEMLEKNSSQEERWRVWSVKEERGDGWGRWDSWPELLTLYSFIYYL